MYKNSQFCTHEKRTEKKYGKEKNSLNCSGYNKLYGEKKRARRDGKRRNVLRI